MDAADVDKAEREIVAACAACGLADEVAALRCLLEFALSVGVSCVEVQPWQPYTGGRVLGVVVQFEFSTTGSIELVAGRLRVAIKGTGCTIAMWKHTYGLMSSWLEDNARTTEHLVSRGVKRLEELSQCAEFYAALQTRELL